MANKAMSTYKDYLSYVNGENLGKYVEMLSSDDIDKFDSLNIDTNKSYIIKSNDKNILRKFQVYFLMKVIRKRPAYKTYLLTEYAKGTFGENEDEDDFMLGSERELLFLLMHNQSMGVGNTELCYEGIILEKVALRKLKEFSTIILSMRELPELESSKEFEVISLGSYATKTSYSTINDKVKENNKEKSDLLDKKIAYSRSFNKNKKSSNSSEFDDNGLDWGEGRKNKDK